MTLTGRRAPSVVFLLTVSAATVLVAKDRIFVDQWSPTRSELFIADADGSNARKLVAGLEIDGSDQRPLTDNRWEEGTPAWQAVPTPRAAKKYTAGRR